MLDFQQEGEKMLPPELKDAPIFRGIPADALERMLPCLQITVRQYARDKYILQSGDRAEAVGLLLRGSVLIVQEDFWGNRNLIAQVAPQELFAEAFACSDGRPLNTGIVAQEDCTVAWLKVSHIMGVCKNACAHHFLLIRNLVGALADKNLFYNEKLTHMAQRTTREKLLSYLSSEALKRGSTDFDIPYDRQQLADYLSVERSAMSAELSKLRREGLLQCHRNHFILRSD